MGRICQFGPEFIACLFRVLASHIIVSDGNVTTAPVRVTRRLTGDIYYVSLSSYYICHDDDNFTFLVSERRCVKNQELFNDSNDYIIYRFCND